MASSSYCFCVISLTVLLPFLLVSASATTYIDAICQHVNDKAFCVKILNSYPKAASATSKFQAAMATISLAKSYADKFAAFAGTVAKKNPRLMKQFKVSQDAFVIISSNLKGDALNLKESPDDANNSVIICTDSTRMVKNLVRKNKDRASKTVLMITLMMEKLIAIAIGATITVGG